MMLKNIIGHARLGGLDRARCIGRIPEGDGAAVTYEKLSDSFDNIILADAQNRYQRASSVAFLTEKYINSGKLPVSANELLPVYLRLPQAERELKKKKELKK